MGATAAIVGATVVGAGVGMYSSKKAADAQSDAAKKQARATQKGMDAATQAQLEMFYTALEEGKPAREIDLQLKKFGQQMAGKLKDYALSPVPAYGGPAYEFQKGEVEKANEAYLAKHGLTGSGAGLEIGRRTAAGLAASEVGRVQAEKDKRINALATLAGYSTNPVSTAGANAAMQTGQNLANIYQSGYGQMANAYGQQGSAQAGGYLGIGSAVNQGIGNALDIYSVLNTPKVA